MEGGRREAAEVPVGRGGNRSWGQAMQEEGGKRITLVYALLGRGVNIFL